MSQTFEYVGNLHVHTLYSDGTADHRALAHVAADAGLDFLVTSDHNMWVPEEEGYSSGVLMLVGEEIHDTARKPQADHYIALRISREMRKHASDPQELIDAVREDGGLGFIAHPFEHCGALARGEPEMDWVTWDVDGYHGIEIWNYMSEFKSHVSSTAKAVILAFLPQIGMLGPFSETLACWDGLLKQGRKVVAIGGSDAHGTLYGLGPLHRRTLPYGFLFRAIRTHIMADAPFDGDLAHDREMVYTALQKGHCFIAYDLMGDARGFRFTARGSQTALMGDDCVLDGTVHLEAVSPKPAMLRLLREGQEVATARGRKLQYEATQSGAYRLEAYLWGWGRRRGWVFTNPIYLVNPSEPLGAEDDPDPGR